MEINQVNEGKNSVLFKILNQWELYEKLANTIHSGNEKELKLLQDKTESLFYSPQFESESLKKRKNEKLESLVLNVTESCNLSCSYCIHSGKYKNERSENSFNMDFKTAQRSVDMFMPLSRKMPLIGFYGGEPLNNFDLIKQIVDYTNKTYSYKLPIFSITSNFSSVPEKIINEIVKNKINITVSLDGPKEIHDKNRRFKDGRPTYDKIIENLTKVEKFSLGYTQNHFSYNATCTNTDNLTEMVRFFQENRQFTNSRINGVESKGLKEKMKGNQDKINFSFVQEYVSSILDEKDSGVLRTFFDRNLKKICLRDTKVTPSTLMLNGCCYPSKHKLFIDTDGTAYMCERFGKRVPIGDVDSGINNSLIDGIMGRFLTIRNDYCTNGCWAQRLCTPCIQSSKDPMNDISQEGLSQICFSNKSQLLVALTQYITLSKNTEILKNYLNSMKFT
jgi:uncharacterized protein